MQLKVGSTYITRNGGRATLLEETRDQDYPYRDHMGYTYGPKGQYINGQENMADLMEEVVTIYPPESTIGGVTGRKDDSGKLDVTLFFDDLPHAIEAVTEVLQWAITKKLPKPYERGSWQGVEDFQRRYKGAQLRHELNRSKALLEGCEVEPTDHETELLELAHIATDAMFRLEMAVRKGKGMNVPVGA
jgi:hypothetical protein